jgi:hypothetical protein
MPWTSGLGLDASGFSISDDIRGVIIRDTTPFQRRRETFSISCAVRRHWLQSREVPDDVIEELRRG